MGIQIKKKECKGTGYAKGLGCGNSQYERKYGLGVKCGCYARFLLTTIKGEELMQKATLKGVQNLDKTKKIKEKKIKDKLRSATVNWKNEFQTEINKIVRLIDYGLPCLAREKFGQIHAGHVFARGGNQYIRYNLHNIHRQNAQSNHFQNDDGLLREGVVREYGSEYMDFISELRRTPKPDYKDFEYEEFTLKSKAIVLELKKKNKKYSLQDRLELRNKINERLGFYDKEYCLFEIKKPT